MRGSAPSIGACSGSVEAPRRVRVGRGAMEGQGRARRHGGLHARAGCGLSGTRPGWLRAARLWPREDEGAHLSVDDRADVLLPPEEPRERGKQHGDGVVDDALQEDFQHEPTVLYEVGLEAVHHALLGQRRNDQPGARLDHRGSECDEVGEPFSARGRCARLFERGGEAVRRVLRRAKALVEGLVHHHGN